MHVMKLKEPRWLRKIKMKRREKRKNSNSARNDENNLQKEKIRGLQKNNHVRGLQRSMATKPDPTFFFSF